LNIELVDFLQLVSRIQLAEWLLYFLDTLSHIYLCAWLKPHQRRNISLWIKLQLD
jgi:hypothetical protein